MKNIIKNTIKNNLLTLRIVFVSLVVLSLFISSAGNVGAQSAGADDVNVQLIVQGCNNNNVCEPVSGETIGNCPNDCIQVVAPPAGGGGGGGGVTETVIPPNTISEVSVYPDTTSAIISWKTSFVTVGTLVWGTTIEYEAGSVSEINYTQVHRVKIENLIPGQKYFYRIDAQDTRARVASAGPLEFTTKTEPDTRPPSNVRNLTGTVQGDVIQLVWVNPSDPDFAGVRVMRSDTSFPLDPLQARLVYEGTGNYFSDANIVLGKVYYYTVFAKDAAGNYSSGSVVMVIYKKESQVVVVEPFPQPIPTTNDQIRNLTLLDFDVIQRGDKVSFTDDSIKLDERDDLILSIDTSKLPPNTKGLAITLEDPSNPNIRQTYLLNENKQDGTYETVIEKFRIGGIYRFNIAVFNRIDEVQKKIPGNFVVPRTALPEHAAFEDVPLTETLLPFIILCILIYILRRIYLFFLWRRKKKKGAENN
jgi:hypothetical protein